MKWMGQRGQSLTEFALVLPIFMLIVFGLIDVGRAIWLQNTFNYAAREAARYASVEQWTYSCPASVPVGQRDRLRCAQQVALDNAVGSPAFVTATATCTTDGVTVVTAANCRAGNLLKIIVQTPTSPANQQFRLFTPLVSSVVGPINIVGQAQVVVQ